MKDDRRVISVPVATVWTSFDSPRKEDHSYLSANSKVDCWIKSQSYDQLLNLCEDNRVQTQVLFGEEVIVQEERGEWCSVLIPGQPSSKHVAGYPGWIPTSLLSHRKGESEELPLAIVESKQAALLFNDGTEWKVSYATFFGVAGMNGDQVIVHTARGLAQVLKKDVSLYPSYETIEGKTGKDLILSAEAFLGLPYLWGGTSGFGYDCSGFTYSICRANGKIIPRDAHDQAGQGKTVPLDRLEPGDLLFFAYEEGQGAIHHVAFYYGDGRIIHAPKTGKTVEIIPLAGMEYERELCAARRYIAEGLQ
ncbi:C40 family peptidase [Bacillus testis]|uniref:C40 family peptidase n=1 Tax=Bacillus testis TaxID=1622072 RepID=UPI00067F5BB1|nr:C40 family peptidase [Bacillus testis]